MAVLDRIRGWFYYVFIMYQSIPSLTISPAKSPGNFPDGRIPTPLGKKELKTLTPGPIKTS